MSALLALWALPAATIGAEEVEVTTYYPEAHGVYDELSTTGPTELAIWNGKVGVGTGAPRGSVEVAGNAAVSQAMTVGQVMVPGGATWRLEDKGGRFALSATQDLGAGTPLETLTVLRPNGYVGIGDFSAGGLPQNHLDVKGGMVVGDGYAGETTAGSGNLRIEGNVGIALPGGQLPQNKLDVAGKAVIGNGYAGNLAVSAGDSLAVQGRVGVGLSTLGSPAPRLAVAGQMVIGDSLTGSPPPGGADLTASGTILTASRLVIPEGTLGGAVRARYGELSGSRYGGEVLGSGTSAGAESDGSAERLFAQGGAGRIFEASTAGPGTITALNTLTIDTTAKSVTVPTGGAQLRISENAQADYVFVSDAGGKGRWVDPLTLDTNGDSKPDLQGPPGANVTELTTPAVIGFDVLYADAVGGPVCNPSDLTHYFKGGGCGSCTAGTVLFYTTDIIDESGTYGPPSVDCPDNPADPGGPGPNDSLSGKCQDVRLIYCTGW